jgi:hypothetical protein
VTPCPKPLPREPKPRKGLRREPLCHCGHSREIHDCTKRGLCAHCIWPSCPKFRPKYPRKRRPRRLSRAGSDPAYLAWVRTQYCAVGISTWRAYVCEGTIHAHHAGRRPGVAMKAPDDTAIPLCSKHHRQWHDGTGVFAPFTKLQRFAWSQRAIADTQGRYSGGRR